MVNCGIPSEIDASGGPSPSGAVTVIPSGLHRSWASCSRVGAENVIRDVLSWPDVTPAAQSTRSSVPERPTTVISWPLVLTRAS